MPDNLVLMTNAADLKNFTLSEIEDLNKLTPVSAVGAILTRNGFKIPEMGTRLMAMANMANDEFANGQSAVFSARIAIMKNPA
jgi:hypothetical protein